MVANVIRNVNYTIITPLFTPRYSKKRTYLNAVLTNNSSKDWVYILRILGVYLFDAFLPQYEYYIILNDTVIKLQ